MSAPFLYALSVGIMALFCMKIVEFEAAMLDAARMLVFPG
jgi:hypothetical protein